MSGPNQPADMSAPSQEELADMFLRLNSIRGTLNNFETQLQQFPALISSGNPPSGSNQTSENVPISQNTTPVSQTPPPQSQTENVNSGRVSRQDQMWRNQPRSRESSHGREDDDFRTISRCSSEPEEAVPKFLLRERPPKFDAKTMCPPQYLEKLKEYIDNHQIKSDKFKISCAKRGLERYHETELRGFSRYINTFSDFEFLFLREFWSTSDKIKQRDRVFKEKFRSRIKDESVYDFYKRIIDQVEKYYPEISLEELKLKFSDQVPGVLSLFIQNSNIKDLDALNNLMKTMGECSSFDFAALSNQKHEKTRRRSPERHHSPARDSDKTDDRNYEKKDNRQQQNNFRGNKRPRGESHRVNVIQEVDSASQNNYRGNSSNYRGHSSNYQGNSSNYRGNSSQYKMNNNRGGYSGRGKPYQRNYGNYNQQSHNSNSQSMDDKLNIFQKSIAKMIDEKFKSMGNNSQPRQEMGGTKNYTHTSTAGSSKEEN